MNTPLRKKPKITNLIDQEVLTPVRRNGGKRTNKTYNLVRNKMEVSDEEFKLIEQAGKLIVCRKFETKESSTIERWYCSLCTTPEYYDNLSKCGWGNKPQWRRVIQHLLQNCIFNDPFEKNDRINMLKGSYKINELMKLAEKYDIELKSQLRVRSSEESKHSILSAMRSQFGNHMDLRNTEMQVDSPSNYRIGPFRRYEFNLQDTCDNLLVAVKGENTALPFDFIDKQSVKAFHMFLGCLQPEKFAELSMNGYRLKRLVNDIIPESILKDASEKLKKAQSQGAINLSTDGWENVRHEKISGFFVFGSQKEAVYPFAYETKKLDDDGVTNACLFEAELPKIEKKLGVKIQVVITDSASQLGMAKRILALRYPSIIFEKCYAHQFNLLCKKMVHLFNKREYLGEGKNLKNFEEDESFIATLKVVIEKINYKKELKMRFKQDFSSYYPNTKCPSLPIAPLCNTRWNTYYVTLSKIVKYRHLIFDILADYDILQSTKKQEGVVKKLLINSFLDGCAKLALLLRPLAIKVIEFQKRGVNKADVMFSFLNIYKTYSKKKNDINSVGLSEVVKEFLKNLSSESTNQTALK